MNTRALTIAMLCALTGVASLWMYLRRYEQRTSGGTPVAVLLATQDLALGSVLTREMLAMHTIPEKYIEERHIRAAQLDRVLGVRVSSAVRAGESVLWTDLVTSTHARRELSQLVQPGMRAVSITTRSGSSFGGLLRPGDRVDVLYLSEQESNKKLVPLLQNILVLATGQDMGGTAGQSASPSVYAQGNQITLSVTLRQSQLIALAKSRGDLTLTLRNPNDIDVIEGLPDTSMEDLVEAERRLTLGRRNAALPEAKEIEHVQ